ncbi:MAG TPA: FAD-binding oxidoreductase [Steroidobacteraceae bacterium]
MKILMTRRAFAGTAFAAGAAALSGRAWSSCADGFTAVAAGAAQIDDIPALTTCGKQFFLRGSDVQELAGRLRGELLLKDSSGYEAARHVWNGAFDRHPALIARCSGAADVMEAVRFAAERQLLVSVRGGGHSLSGQSVCEKGLMIDLSQMNSVRVDAKRRVAIVEGGALLGALDRESLVHNLATTAGTVSHTGVGGLTLGGGFGRIGRKYGLTCDNVRSIDLVTAKGQLVTASHQQNRDLFWGLRGGGGNFGVATTFEFQLHPVNAVMLGGNLVYSFEDAPAVLQHLLEYAPEAPDELNLDISLVRLPDDQRFMSIDVCWCGPWDAGEKALASLRQVRKPQRDDVAPTPYVKLQASGDEGTAHGHKYYIKGGFVQKSSAGLRDVMLATIAEAKLPVISAVALPQGGGAYARVKPKATAFAQRAADHNVFLFSRWDDPAMSGAVAEWTRDSWRKVEPHTHGFYVNEYNAEDAGRVEGTYGSNYPRLRALKDVWDPNNLFRMNANVAPSAF